MGRPRKTLTPDEIFCLDGWLANGDSVTAYKLSHNSQSESFENLQKMASRWLGREDVRNYIEARRKAEYKAVTQSESGEAIIRTRADAETELNAIISSTTDPKIKADALMKLADLNKWKQAEQTDEDNRISFYIPLQVDRCIELFVYRLKKRFGWNDEEARIAEEIMTKVEQYYEPNE